MSKRFVTTVLANQVNKNIKQILHPNRKKERKSNYTYVEYKTVYDNFLSAYTCFRYPPSICKFMTNQLVLILSSTSNIEVDNIILIADHCKQI
jgi:hypothetical protein